MIAAPSRAFGAIDRQEPVDDRTDDEIEQDAAARSKREIKDSYVRPDALWDAVEAKRKSVVYVTQTAGCRH